MFCVELHWLYARSSSARAPSLLARSCLSPADVYSIVVRNPETVFLLGRGVATSRRAGVRRPGLSLYVVAARALLYSEPHRDSIVGSVGKFSCRGATPAPGILNRLSQRHSRLLLLVCVCVIVYISLDSIAFKLENI